MSSLAVFRFDSQEVRFIDGKPVANDVAKVLGYSQPHSTIAKKVSPENKGCAEMATPGGTQSVVTLEEAGIYQLIFSSKIESAKRFQQWVFSEVLPSIRRTGSYSTQQELPETYLDALKALVKAEEQKLLMEAEKKQLQQENELLSEAVDELFDYSSIIRIAKFNKVHEKAFEWRKLKAASDAMGLEVKRVPCPRFETKNLYAHDAWRFCYPEMRLPETTTLVIKSVA